MGSSTICPRGPQLQYTLITLFTLFAVSHAILPRYFLSSVIKKLSEEGGTSKRSTECLDEEGVTEYCVEMQSLGYCTNEKFKEDMSLVCAATCGCSQDVVKRAAHDTDTDHSITV